MPSPPAREDASRWRRSLRWTAAIGALVWIVLRLVPGAPDGLIERVLLLAILTVTPLAFALLPQIGNSERHLVGAIALLLPVAAGGAVASLWKPDGGAAAGLASGWLGLTGLGAALGVVRLVRMARGRAPRDAPGALTLTALLFLPVGGAWLIAARLGTAPAELDPLTVTLTAVHFHYAAFGAPMLAAVTVDWLKERASAASTLTTRLLTGSWIAGLLGAFGIAALPAIELAGGLLLAFAVLLWAGLVLSRVIPHVGWLPRILFAISALSPLVSMPLAVTWTWGEATGARFLDLGWMIRLHGYANAHGFVLCGLLGWTAALAGRAPRRTSTTWSLFACVGGSILI